MTRRRDVLAGIAAIASGVGITGASAAVAQRPDKVLHDAIAQYLKATEDRRATEAAWTGAFERATARYPAEIEKWVTWRERNHPGGKRLVIPFTESTSPRMLPLRAELDAWNRDAPDCKVIPNERDFFRRVAEAHFADEEEYYASIRSEYDLLIADRQAAIAAIDGEENLGPLGDFDSIAYTRRSEAYYALLACRPTTWAAFAIKAQAVLQTPWSSDGDIEPEEKEALLADIAALTAGDAA